MLGKTATMLGVNCWDNQRYFSSMVDASSTERPPIVWPMVAEYLLRCIEVPMPWDVSCTALGRCPENMRCYTTGHLLAIVCENGLLRDHVEAAAGVIGGYALSAVFIFLAILIFILLRYILFGTSSPKRRQYQDNEDVQKERTNNENRKNK